jgi:hypothetical protein
VHPQAHNWKWLFAFNWVIVGVFFLFGLAAIAFSLKSIVNYSYTFGVFAESCYQCSYAAGAAAATQLQGNTTTG